jgi:hypothetical protein
MSQPLPIFLGIPVFWNKINDIRDSATFQFIVVTKKCRAASIASSRHVHRIVEVVDPGHTRKPTTKSRTVDRRTKTRNIRSVASLFASTD